MQDNCTIPLLNKDKAYCNIVQENNVPLLILYHGNIIIDGNHIWNGQNITGTKLIQFNISTTLDNKTYFNHDQEIKNIIHGHQNEQIKIMKILESKSNYKFSNIQEMYKYLIPVEERPLQFLSYAILLVII